MKPTSIQVLPQSEVEEISNAEIAEFSIIDGKAYAEENEIPRLTGKNAVSRMALWEGYIQFPTRIMVRVFPEEFPDIKREIARGQVNPSFN